MVHPCSVPACIGSKGGLRFPKDPKLLLKWQVAIKRLEPKTKKLWTPTQYSRICHKHFKPKDYRVPVCSSVQVGGKPQRRLKPDVVPSIFPYNSVKDEGKARRSEERARRLERRRFESALAEEINPDDLVNGHHQVNPNYWVEDLDGLVHVVEPEVVVHESPEVDRESVSKGLKLKPVEASVVKGLKLKPVTPSEIANLVRIAKERSHPESVMDTTNECLGNSLVDDSPKPIKKYIRKTMAATNMSPELRDGGGEGVAIITEPSDVTNEVIELDGKSQPGSGLEPFKKISTVKKKGCQDFQCPKCRKKFAGNGVLNLHMRRVHPRVESFTCSQCGKGFKSKDELVKHDLMTHGLDSAYAKQSQVKRKIASVKSPEKSVSATIILVTDGNSSEATPPPDVTLNDQDNVIDLGTMSSGNERNIGNSRKMSSEEALTSEVSEMPESEVVQSHDEGGFRK